MNQPAYFGVGWKSKQYSTMTSRLYGQTGNSGVKGNGMLALLALLIRPFANSVRG